MVKNKIRKSLLEQGHILSSKEAAKLNNKIQNNILNSFDLSKKKNVLLYFPYKKEVTLELIKSELNKYSHDIYMPKIFPRNQLRFNLCTNGATLTKNKFGIPELDNTHYLDPHLFDVMFIPFVGVDADGCRIGYGGGYFDRALSNFKKHERKTTIIGLGYDYQILDKKISEPHDLKYDLVATESRILSYS
ncbi:5-formyltetrahydrofolate cyclo-ligase [Gammaproteobacteria bacterium]|jgi:5-formyltetrahydrofolate cyclo-ligase|nr:5-formyltetrahydrofolate cyclo-ligase [Gammaproteobacteria bacterium]